MTGETVFVVEDDEAMRTALSDLLTSVGHTVSLFPSAVDFMETALSDPAGCLILDIRLPGMSGLDFQRRLVDLGIELPIIFITGHGDISMSVQAMKAGAHEFLTKPFRDQSLLDVVTTALERGRARRAEREAMGTLVSAYDSLSPREREIMGKATEGRLNKLIAADFGLSEVTVKVYRRHIMSKMGARSIAELARIAERLARVGAILKVGEKR